MSKKYVVLFKEADGSQKALLGGKGANLAEMTRIGLPVPPGFTITTEACNEYYRSGGQLPSGLIEEVFIALKQVEEITAKKYGDMENPLLISVRSGAAVSMPGMMDTILNLGLNDQTVEAIAGLTKDERFALDCYRRFIQMFSSVVLDVEHALFDSVMERYKERLKLSYDFEIPAEQMREIINEFKEIVARTIHNEFPQDVAKQLEMAIVSVFASWNTPRAIVYRRANKISDDLGTAVNIQSMVFGNMGADSGTGVAFTRNPSTGEHKLYGEFLVNAQGEDVVAGIRTPFPINMLQEQLPAIYREFVDICAILENHYRDLQDIEFTVEKGKLYILQTRNGKRTAHAAVRAAVEMVDEGIISKKEALMRIEADQLDQLLHRQIDTKANMEIIARGLPASPGAGSGKVVFDADEVEKAASEGEKVVLVRNETTPDDIHGIIKAEGVLTSRGGMTSHAAVVARGMGKPCVCGCENVKISPDLTEFTVDELVVKKGDIISIDGTTGNVMLGEVPMIDPVMSLEFETLLKWADEAKKLSVRANADTPEDALKAREFGAEGIGLCRTEHMFMAQERLPIVQEMIMSDTVAEREAALAKILPFQRDDFYGIFKAMESLPVTIRFLDPPLHEFLPNDKELMLEIAELKFKNGPAEEIKAKEYLLKKVNSLHEVNPMLGHRGTRLGITYPEIYRMQARAVFEAVVSLKKEGLDILPEVEIPLVMDRAELAIMKEEVLNVYQEVVKETGLEFEFKVGTMIELPRACMMAEEIAEEAEFFSFGTNDLTQTTFGFSRDDAEGKYIPIYMEKKIIKENPFAVLDRQGVGGLMKIAVEKGRQVKPDILIGICGEHGGEPSSIEFCHMLGLEYVSCSPYRVPIARLAAAQAAISNQGQSK
ncbi:MAG: pyruvate, phosphate dikinase [Syntrophomonadaceae bacterium]|nr:pyruvate, phosphate dikinase [Syntrophomonadaceae bacterium]